MNFHLGHSLSLYHEDVHRESKAGYQEVVVHTIGSNTLGHVNERMDAQKPGEGVLHWSNAGVAGVWTHMMRKHRFACEVMETPYYYDAATVDGTHWELATCAHSDVANVVHHALIAAFEADRCEVEAIRSCVEENDYHSCVCSLEWLEGQESVVASYMREHLAGMTGEGVAKYRALPVAALSEAQE